MGEVSKLLARLWARWSRKGSRSEVGISEADVEACLNHVLNQLRQRPSTRSMRMVRGESEASIVAEYPERDTELAQVPNAVFDRLLVLVRSRLRISPDATSGLLSFAPDASVERNLKGDLARVAGFAGDGAVPPPSLDGSIAVMVRFLTDAGRTEVVFERASA